MCFSATASFGVAAALAGAGVVSASQKRPAGYGLLAATPLLFAAQQVAEGMVWSTIRSPEQAGVQAASVAVFLGFALVLYPTWAPLSLLVPERNRRRRKALGVLLAFGVCVSLYAAALLIHKRPIAQISNHSITYQYGELGSTLVLALYLPGYVIPTVGPFFVSTMKHAKVIGAILAFGLVATFLMKRQALTSVWCFFAAAMSGVIVLSLAAEHRIASLSTRSR